MRDKLYFRPAARLQVVLSEELVSDPNVAVLEFVKNSYDAEASEVLVRFELGERAVDSRLIIVDDGTGMDRAGLERNWMRPGFSEKPDIDLAPGKRVPVGEKGLGRLAAGRLGEQLDLYTRRRTKDSWLHLGFRWSDFNDMRTPLDEVPVWVDDLHPPPEGLAEQGTIVLISRLRMRWDSRVPGRRVKGRAPTRIGRLRQDLELLLLPLLAEDSGFAVTLEHNSVLKEDRGTSGAIEPPELELLDYQVEFALERDADEWFLLRTVRRSDVLAKRLGKRPVSEEQVPAATLSSEVDFAALGSFSGSMYYAPESAKQLQQIRAPVGVRVYRDGVRVDPYGEPGDDWLGARALKASRQGHAAIQPNALYGAIRTSRRDNPELRPLANREGLVDNDALEAFLLVCREQLRWFGEIIQEEYREPAREERRAVRESGEREAAALNVQRYAVAVTRATVHAVRQPVTGAGTELRRIQGVLRSKDVPDEVRATLQDLHDRTEAHLQRIDAAVARMMDFLDFDPTPLSVDLVALARKVLRSAESDARSQQVELSDDLDDLDLTIEVPRGLVERSLEELVDNAIHAPRPESRTGSVRVEAARENGLVRISVVDNGAGIPGEIAERLFNEAISTHGHIGVGLLFNRQLLALARGDLILSSTGPEGSKFDIILPA